MAERPGPWELLDRPSDPVVADVVAFDARLDYFSQLADAMRTEGQRLAKIASGDALKGKYADELRSGAGDVSKDLDQVVGRYEAVVQALQGYQPALESALSGSAQALDDAIDADSAQRAANAMPTATAPDGAQLTAQQVQDNSDKTAAVGAAADRLNAAKAKLSGVLGQLDDAGRQAAATIRQGFNDGLTDSGWDRFKYAFKKFLQILVKVLTYIGMALAVAALVIPGVGEAIFAAGVALAAVTVVANGALIALGGGSWADFGIAVASLFTFGAAKVFGPAIQAGLKSLGSGIGRAFGGGAGSVAEDTGTAGADAADDAESAAANSADDAGSDAGNDAGDDAGSGQSGTTDVADDTAADAGPSASDDAPPKDWNVPDNSTPVDHPDLGPNNSNIVPGTSSFKSATGAIYTRVNNFVGYKGTVGGRGDFYLKNGAIREPGATNGNYDENWKAFYTTDDVDGAKGYASAFDEDTMKFISGDVLRYEHGGETTIVSPPSELGDVGEAQTTLNLDPSKPVTEALGDNNQILRNPLSDGDTEYVVPWNVSGQGTVTRIGQMVSGRGGKDDPEWVPIA